MAAKEIDEMVAVSKLMKFVQEDADLNVLASLLSKYLECGEIVVVNNTAFSDTFCEGEPVKDPEEQSSAD